MPRLSRAAARHLALSNRKTSRIGAAPDEAWHSTGTAARPATEVHDPVHGYRPVDRVWWAKPKAAANKAGQMDLPFISGRPALADASELIDRFGDDAGLEAAARAESSRDAGNVLRFCHWRQIERVIASLANDEVRGTVH